MRVRRRRFAAKRSRRRSAWMSSASPDACPTLINVDRCEEIVQDPDVFQIIQNPIDPSLGVVTSLEEVTVARVVGEIMLYTHLAQGGVDALSVCGIEYSLGLFHADTDPAGAIAIKDPSSAGDQESKDWLWRDTEAVSAVLRNASVYQGEPRSIFEVRKVHLDVRVKRKIRKEEGIYLSVKALLQTPLAADPTEIDCFISANIRSLVLLP